MGRQSAHSKKLHSYEAAFLKVKIRTYKSRRDIIFPLILNIIENENEFNHYFKMSFFKFSVVISKIADRFFSKPLE